MCNGPENIKIFITALAQGLAAMQCCQILATYQNLGYLIYSLATKKLTYFIIWLLLGYALKIREIGLNQLLT